MPLLRSRISARLDALGYHTRSANPASEKFPQRVNNPHRSPDTMQPSAIPQTPVSNVCVKLRVFSSQVLFQFQMIEK
jgi:hypothetical protein